ncbi:hypothetical protein BJ170DRAFT_683259 [Xylariales sp. AK1849]|nr:hypothetical protein BJ170DRAFT_683259 [Xylariales sp. AK1849]
MNPVGSFENGRTILGRLAKVGISQAIKSSDLEEAAYLTLCHLHRDQAGTVSRQWSSLLRAWVSHNGQVPCASGAPSSKTKSSASSTYTCNAAFGATRNAKVKQEDDAQRYTQNLLREQLGEILKESMKLDEKLRLWDEKLAEQERYEHVKREQQARKDEERKQKEQDDREEEIRHKAEQVRQERDMRAERRRLAKEQQEKKARDRAAKEADAWTHSWKNYTEAWDEIKTIKSNKFADTQSIPWPVKSGLFFDVDVASIRLFFKKAPPKNLADTGESWFKFINSENKRWHTDKMMQQFGADVVNGECKEAFDTIARTVIQLRQEAQRDRRN